MAVTPRIPLSERIQKLSQTVKEFLDTTSPFEKIEILNNLSEVQEYLKGHSALSDAIEGLPTEGELALKSIIAIGEGPILFQGLDEQALASPEFNLFLGQLLDVEKSYDTIGGIIGYHLTVLKLIIENEEAGCQMDHAVRYSKPEGLNLAEDSAETRQAIIDGLVNLPQLATFYPVGGAGDRLMLKDEETDEMLPAARLQFAGRTLLETNFRDLQGREYLYYKVFGKQLLTPVAMMTSHEKNNHAHIVSICEHKRWFGRPQHSFFLFIQPLAPVITKEGHWSLKAPLHLNLKPGGHGVIWKLAHDAGVFEWLKTLNRSKGIVRQINNPIAGTDNGILGLIGVGCQTGKSFGFASCDRLIHAAEGMDVLVERKQESGYEYCISNIEYTEFTKKGLEDVPESSDSPYSAFPANTNLLFFDIAAVNEAVKHNPLPGMVLNLKNKAIFLDRDGTRSEIEAGRLETTMQNIADSFADVFTEPINHETYHKLRTFLTYNQRSKTISVTKKVYTPGKPAHETPENSFYDYQTNNRVLLVDHCGFQVPAQISLDAYLKDGPPLIFLFHPALGPLWSIIGQKVHGGRLAPKAEMQLEIAEVDVKNLDLDGSLSVRAQAVMGEKNTQELLRYSEMCGKCELINVTIKNKGIDWERSRPYWKTQYTYHEALKIVLKGTGEFYAENVTFNGNHLIQVPDGIRMTAFEENGVLQFKSEKIIKPTWFWKYTITDDKRIHLTKIKT